MTASRTTGPAVTTGDRAATTIRAWVALYTRGLHADVADDRRAEIEADLWDEVDMASKVGETAGLGRRRISRLIRGMPADVAWRLEQRERSTKAPWRTTMHISRLELVAIVAATIYCCAFVVSGLLSSTDFREWEGMVPAVVGFVLAAVGLLLAIPKPKAGLWVGMIGIGLAFLVMPWMYLFYLPVPIALAFRYYRGGQGSVGEVAPGA